MRNTMPLSELGRDSSSEEDTEELQMENKARPIRDGPEPIDDANILRVPPENYPPHARLARTHDRDPRQLRPPGNGPDQPLPEPANNGANLPMPGVPGNEPNPPPGPQDNGPDPHRDPGHRRRRRRQRQRRRRVQNPHVPLRLRPVEQRIVIKYATATTHIAWISLLVLIVLCCSAAHQHKVGELNKEHETEVQHLEKGIEELQKDNRGLRNTLSSKLEEVENKSAALQHEVELNKKHKADKRHWEKRYEKLQGKNHRLEDTLIQTTDERKKVKNECAMLTGAALRRKVDELGEKHKTTVQHLGGKIGDLQKANDDLKKERIQTTSKLKEVETKNGQLMDNVTQQKKTIKHLQEANRDLQITLNQTTSKLEIRENKYVQLIDNATQQLKTIEDLQGTNQGLQITLNQTTSKLEKLENKCTALQHEVDELSDRYKNTPQHLKLARIMRDLHMAVYVEYWQQHTVNKHNEKHETQVQHSEGRTKDQQEANHHHENTQSQTTGKLEEVQNEENREYYHSYTTELLDLRCTSKPYESPKHLFQK